MSAIENSTKLCTCCRHDRPVGRFLYSQFTTDGLTDRCLDCISAAALEARIQRDRRRPAPIEKSKRKVASKRRRHAARPSPRPGPQSNGTEVFITELSVS